VGYAIGRNVGHAVVRNALRRRARAAAREVAGGLPRGTYLLRIEPAAVRRDRAELAANVREALMRAGRAVGAESSSGSRVASS
jgi:ribonuclease P protein component